ncbi:hypothetical protein ACEV99_23245, partial [Vibrio parahaemolyticus]
MDCARCHTVTVWKTVNFNHNTMTNFPLLGKHAAAKCEACHGPRTAPLKVSAECGSCHAKDDVHAGKLGKDCARCHNSAAWKGPGQIRFDHDLT